MTTLQPGHGRRCLLPCLAMLSVLVSGCAIGSAATPVPTQGPPTATPTIEVGFVVAVTPQPTRAVRKAAPTPTITPVIPRHRPYIRLSPASGSPASTTITVQGWNLPRSIQVNVVWRAKGRLGLVGTEAYTSRDGRLSVQFAVPESQPGAYRIEVEQAGGPIAWAAYSVRSRATMTVSVALNRSGDNVTISGRHFLPSTKLYLVVYSALRGQKPVPIGTVWSDSRGKMSYSYSTRKLLPGEYILRAYSQSAISAEMAQTFFEVVL